MKTNTKSFSITNSNLYTDILNICILDCILADDIIGNSNLYTDMLNIYILDCILADDIIGKLDSHLVTVVKLGKNHTIFVDS